MPYKTLVEMQEASCRDFADRPIYGTKIKNQWQWITYGQFGKFVSQARGGFNEIGLRNGGTVAIISRNCVEWAVAAYACYGLGGRFVGMYESQSSAEWEYILHDCQASIVLTHNAVIADVISVIASKVPTIKHIINLQSEEHKGLLTFEKLLKLGQDHPVPTANIDPKQIVSIIYTSGTTDKPKGVLLNHDNIISQLRAVRECYEFSPEDRSLSFLPWAHIFGQVGDVHILIGRGFSAAFAEGVEQIVNNLAEIQPTMIMSVPRIFNRIFDKVTQKMQRSPAPIRKLFYRGMELATRERNGGKLSWFDSLILSLTRKLLFARIKNAFGGRLKYAISGGSSLQLEVAEFIANLGITVYEGYGLSETSPMVSTNRPGIMKLGTVGKPIPGVEVKLDRTNVDSDIPDAGEIVVYGPNVMQGYNNAPEETARVLMKDGGFRTGDLGRFDENGFLLICGRTREQFKLQNGKWVLPAAIEEALNLSPYIQISLVYGENRDYTIAVINVHLDEVVHYARTRGLYSGHHDVIPPQDIQRIMHHEDVQKLFTKVIKEQCANCKSYEVPKHFLLTHEDWSPTSGFQTQSFKLRRSIIVSHYADEIEKLYHEARSFLETSN